MEQGQGAAEGGAGGGAAGKHGATTAAAATAAHAEEIRARSSSSRTRGRFQQRAGLPRPRLRHAAAQAARRPSARRAGGHDARPGRGRRRRGSLASKAAQRAQAEAYVRAAAATGDHRTLGRLLDALETYARTGTLSEVALAFLWHDIGLKREHYAGAARMLCDAGVLLELPAEPPNLLSQLLPGIFGASSEERQRYAVPMRLPEKRPAAVDTKWDGTAGQDGRPRLGVRFDFFGLPLPPGTIERCVAGCAAGALRECWRHGALLDDRALLERVVDADGSVVSPSARGGGAAAAAAAVAAAAGRAMGQADGARRNGGGRAQGQVRGRAVRPPPHVPRLPCRRPFPADAPRRWEGAPAHGCLTSRRARTLSCHRARAGHDARAPPPSREGDAAAPRL